MSAPSWAPGPATATPGGDDGGRQRRGRRALAGRPAFLAVTVAALVLGACTSGAEPGVVELTLASPTTGDGTTVDRAAGVLATIDLAVAAQAEAADTGTALATTAAQWCAGEAGGGSLGAAQAAWSAATVARQRQVVVGTGPTETTDSMSRVDWPVDVAALDDLLAGDDPITADTIADGPASRRGLGAIEAVLFVEGRQPTEPGDRTCDFLVVATAALADELDRLQVAWLDGSDGRSAEADRLRGVGPEPASAQDTVQALVQAQVFATDDLVDMLLSGVLGEAGDDQVGDGPAGAGASRIDATLAQLSQVHDADHLAGVYGAVVEARMATAIEDAREALGTGPAAVVPLGVRDEANVRTLRDAMEEVRTLLRTDVTAALDVQVGFSDNDGDSG